eukprot:SAG11_NODE_11842_length_735_cov_1.455975_2_plen_179_part_01
MIMSKIHSKGTDVNLLLKLVLVLLGVPLPASFSTSWLNRPTSQSTHSFCLVSFWYCLALQSTQSRISACGWLRPTSQSMQSDEPTAGWYLPVSHKLQNVLSWDWNFPGTHIMHSCAPSPLAYLPASQRGQLPCPRSAWNFPAVHASQLVSDLEYFGAQQNGCICGDSLAPPAPPLSIAP